jgi:2-C-methyl-D-erythritol 4-phosphate cytidylyltransferase
VKNARVDESAIALVHGPGWPVATPEAIARLFDALRCEPQAAVAILVGPQTDTLKSIDAAGMITGTLDRSAFGAVKSPLAVRPSALPDAARTPAQPGAALPAAREVLAAALHAGCRIIEVPAEPAP